MNILNSTYTRGIIGIGVGTGVALGASILFPMTSTNLAGHIMAWIMGAIIGIKITLSSLDNEESWMEGPLEVESEDVKEFTTVGSRATGAPIVAEVFEPNDRMSWKPAEEPVLEFPANSGRNLKANPSRQVAFHNPDEEERKECIQFAAENPICSLATIDEENEGQPHVRTVFLWRADESGFYFVLFSSKNVSRQVKAHPDVELCFQNHPSNISEAKQLRVHGQFNLLQNRQLIEEASNDRHILNTLAGDGKDANIEIYHLSDFEMKFWQMGALAQQMSAEVTS